LPTGKAYDIIEMLKAEYRVQDVIDYSCLEYDDLFLEGTGAMVGFDIISDPRKFLRLAYEVFYLAIHVFMLLRVYHN
jgi:hypothetical protein